VSAPDSTETPHLVVQAADQLRKGELPTARALLERAAREFGAQGDVGRQRWCAQVAGALARYQARRAAAGDQDPDDVVLSAVVWLVSSASSDADGVGVGAGPRTAPGADVAVSVRETRASALDKRDAAGYLTAAVAEALLADETGDRVGAYRSLAVAWVTLGDLIGPKAAGKLVSPQLINWRNNWGAEAFAEARAGYEAQVKEDVGG
jgi:uncharacterized MAPEG superfamily protein